MPLLKSIHHVAIICSDYERSRVFYHETLGLSIKQEVYREARQSWKCDLAIDANSHVELFSFPEPPLRPSRPEAQGLRHLAFLVDDIDAAVAELQQRGVVTEPIRIDEYTGRRFTFFADPDDLPIELYEGAA